MSKKLNTKRLETLFEDIQIPKSDPHGKEQTAKPCVSLDIPSDEARPAPPDPQPVKPQENIELSCPHIGLLYDPQTSLAYPSEWNVCHRASPINTPKYEHQRVYCLAVSYGSCPFFRKKPDTPLPEYIRL
jgi:hypothetical protein